MNYIAHLVQKGEGCDYMIGCGLQVVKLSSDNMKDAEKELSELIKEEYSYDEAMLETATLYEVKEAVEVDVDAIYNEKENSKQAQAEEKERIKDFEEFQRLKKKFEE